jgi:BirA family biotin operon repressor/biotin-[acetyl-CoA-carboxylase] ligase
VPPLRRAVAVAEVHRVSARVTEDLELDVPRPREVALHVALGPAEVRLGLALRRLERARGAVGVGDDLHAAPAAPVCSFDRDRISELGSEVEDLLHVGDRLCGARHRLDLRVERGDARRDLVAHDLDRLGRRSDPRHAGGDERAREVGVLGEEAVARVHAVRGGSAHRVEDRLGVEVALGRGLAAQRVGLVRVPNVFGVAVELGVHGDGRDPELATRAHNAHRDLTSVRDQDLREQCIPYASWRPATLAAGGRILSLVHVGHAIWSDARLVGTRFRDVRWFASIDSTNRYLLEAARGGAPEGVVAVADEQTAGRGRLGRSWVAPPGASLLVSALLRPDLPSDSLALLTMAAGLACIAAVETEGGFAARLKWPNDVVVDDRKLAGILAEKDGGAVVVGMGCNVHWDTFPDELASIGTACNLCTDRAITREELLGAWLREFDARLDALGGVIDEATARSATLGRRVRVEVPDGSYEADAVSLTAHGHLVVLTDDGTETAISSADVIHLRAG